MSTFPSTLIIASSPQTAYKKAIETLTKLQHKEVNNPDLFILDDYTIACVRTLKKFLSQKPFNHSSKVVLIPEAENLNTESQNALLKILEEPGNDNYLLLTTTNITKLLPTIISRCQKIKLNSDNLKSDIKLWPITGNSKKDLDFASSVTPDKNEIKDLLQGQLKAYQQLLTETPDPSTAQIIKKLISALDLINNNVDPKSALDYFFLK
jgi:replication-associated recombination protein RarA